MIAKFNTLDDFTTTSGNLSYTSMVALDDTRICVLFGDTAPNEIDNRGRLRVCSIENHKAVMHSSPIFCPNNNTWGDITKLDTNKTFIAYNTPIGRARIVMIDGNEIDETLDILTFSNQNVSWISTTTIEDNVVIAYYDGTNGKAVIGEIDSEDNVTFGAEYTFNIGSCSNITVIDINGRICISFCDGTDGGKGKCVLGTVSGNIIIFTDKQYFCTQLTYNPTIIPTIKNKLCISYCTYSPSSKLNIKIGEVKGNTIEWRHTSTAFPECDFTTIKLEKLSDKYIGVAVADDSGTYGGSVVICNIEDDNNLSFQNIIEFEEYEIYYLSFVKLNKYTCGLLYSGWESPKFIDILTPLEIIWFDELSGSYKVKENIRGSANEGYIRPTLKQFFTSKNFNKVLK